MEQVGPDKPDRPTRPGSLWPKRIVDIPRHPSRVYSVWFNGLENFYFKATPAEVNEIVTLFSKARMREHDVVIGAERKEVKPSNGEPIDYSINLQIAVSAMPVFNPGEKEPRLTIFAGGNQTLIEKVTWPKNVTITSEIPGLSVPSGMATPQRDAYYAKCEFVDGSPPSEFVQNSVYGRITLWEQQEEDGIVIGRVDNQGYVRILLSKEEMADLQAGKTWLTATIADLGTEARKTDQRIPAGIVTTNKDRAKAIQVQGIPYYYGRILFEDGSPPVLDSPPWPRAEILVDAFSGRVVLDSNGYFKVRMTKEMFERVSASKTKLSIYIPDPTKEGRESGANEFAASLLSPDKATAVVVKIPRPVFPLIAAESKIGKAIPGFDNIRFEGFQPDQAKGKALLVCFWDFDQRSSRQCVEALGKQKNVLEQKGLVVLVVHAGSQPQEQVRDWLGKTGVTLTSGTIQGDPHDVLLAWGAKGMPWLVLTDARHVVTKEGFTVDQLLENK